MLPDELSGPDLNGAVADAIVSSKKSMPSACETVRGRARQTLREAIICV